MNTLSIVQLSVSWFFIIAVLLPFVRNDYWVFRILEYPRYQKFVICSLVLFTYAYNNELDTTWGLITFVLLVLCVLYLAYKIFPYTWLAKKEMKRITGGDPQNQVKIFSANVYQDNQRYQKLIAQIRRWDPDVIMLLETDRTWEREMDILLQQYPHYLKEPLENTYGLLFYSRFPITEGRILYLVENDVPSIEAILQLPSGHLVKVWGLHPKPPVPGEDSRSTAKDKEIMKVALKVRKEKLPAIVMGDFNDVAWSHITELFRKTSGILDPRIGRGFYSTFSANYWFLRFPLDYVFCSAHFGVIKMKRLKHNGSDHFPMFSHFEFQPALKDQQEKPEADLEELEEASEKATQDV